MSDKEVRCVICLIGMPKERRPPQSALLSYSSEGVQSRNSKSSSIETSFKKLNEEFPFTPQYVHIIPSLPLSKITTEANIRLEGLNEAMENYYSCDVLEQFVESETEIEVIKRLKKQKMEENAFKKVVDAFANWGRRNKMRMFIFTNTMHKDYDRPEHQQASAADLRDKIQIVRIICEQVGIIFIQVIYCTGETDRTSISEEIREALKQLERFKLKFFKENEDLHFITPRLPTYTFVAAPFLTDENLQLQLCLKHEQSILGRESLNRSEFYRIKTASSPPYWSSEECRCLSARYLSEYGSVQTLSQVIKTTSQSMDHQLYVEYPTQEAILNKQRIFQAIKGDFGTGKTSVLCRKAVESLTEYCNSKVVFFICLELDKYLQLHTKLQAFPLIKFVQEYLMTLESTIVKQREVEICTLGNLYAEYCKLVGKPCKKYVRITTDLFIKLLELRMAENCNIFIDELPLELFHESQDLLIEIAKLKRCNIVWVALAAQSLYRNVALKSETVGSHFERFQLNSLVHNMRNCRSVLSLMKYISSYTTEECDTKAVSGIAVQGPKPLLLRMATCYCAIKSYNEVGVFCSCLQHRLKKTLKFVHQKLQSSIDDTDTITYFIEHIYNDSFASPIFDKLLSLVQSVFHSLGILKPKFQWITLANKTDKQLRETYDPKGIKIFDWTTFVGSESPVVVNIDFFAMSQWLPESELYNGSTMVLSRCTSQYVHIVLQGDEPKIFIEQHIAMFQSHIDKHKHEQCEGENHQKSMQDKEKFVKVMQKFIQNEGNLLNNLLEKGLLIEEFIPDNVDSVDK